MRYAVLMRVAAVAVLLAACASPPRREVWRAEDFVVRAGQLHRIAVLPFRDATPAKGLLWYLGRPFSWLARAVTLNFGSSPPTPAAAADMLRTMLVARLQGETVAVVNPSMVDASLAALPADFDRQDLAALAQHLDVDGFIEGEVVAVGATYRLLSTHRELGARIGLWCSSSHAEVFRARVDVDDSAGIERGPTGLIGLFAVPIAALDSGPYTNMAIAWADAVAGELFGTADGLPPPPPPVLQELRVQAPERTLGAGDVIDVVALGTAGHAAHFDLGSLHRQIPMFAAPEAPGTYRGTYTVQRGDRVDKAPLIVQLGNHGGSRARLQSTRLFDIATGSSP